MNISKDQQKNCFLFLSCHSKQPLKTIPTGFLVLVLFLRFFFFFFLMGTILKVFIELVTIFLLLLMLCLVTLSCPTLRDPVDCSLPGSSVHGIPQARILQWIAMCSSRGSSQPRYQTQGSPTAGRFFTI